MSFERLKIVCAARPVAYQIVVSITTTGIAIWFQIVWFSTIYTHYSNSNNYL